MGEVKKILFFTDAQLGDLLLLTPALKALKEKIPEIKISLLLLHRRYYSNATPRTEITKTNFEGTAQVFMHSGLADEIFELDRQSMRSLRGLKRIKAEQRCIGFLKKMKFDAMICSFPQSRFVLWAFLSRCPIRIGQKKQPFSYLLSNTPDITAKGNGVLNYYCNLVRELGVDPQCTRTIYTVTIEEKKTAQTLLQNSGIDLNRKIVFVHPGASGAYKVWPPAYFAEVIDHIIEKNLAQVVICSNSFDEAVVEQICLNSKNKLTVLNLRSVRELAAVINLCTAALVNNSGPRHISAALGVKSVSIFQKYDKGEWKIYDDEVHRVAVLKEKCPVCFNDKCESLIRNGEQFGSECMWLVKPLEVIVKISDILKKID